MADAFHHALSSAKKWGGEADDYLPVHNWFDATKRHFSDPRHRALRHHSEGIGLCIDVFGPAIEVSACSKCGKGPLHDSHMSDEFEFNPHPFTAKVVPVRWIGEQHVLEDFGRIPTAADFLRCMTIEPWMVRGARPLSREF